MRSVFIPAPNWPLELLPSGRNRTGRLADRKSRNSARKRTVVSEDRPALPGQRRLRAVQGPFQPLPATFCGSSIRRWRDRVAPWASWTPGNYFFAIKDKLHVYYRKIKKANLKIPSTS